MTGRIVIATPHRRYRPLVERMRARGTEVRHVESREELDPEAIAAFGPDYIFFPHWSWKIPPTIYEPFEAVIFHMADVPFGRGGSPLQNLVRLGLRETKLTALRCTMELDAGPVYLKRPLSLLGTAEEIFLRAAELMGDMIAEMLEKRPRPVEQSGEVVMFKRLTPADGDLSETGSIEQLFDRIRMLDAKGYPPAFVDAGGFRFEFSRASLKPGEVVADVRIRRHEED
jgi:methionyl-tRNA formyltransferase